MKLFAQYLDTKLINSLPYCNTIHCTLGDVSNNLYQIHYRYQFNKYLFCSNLLTTEILQFIQEFGESIHCVIYHPDEINVQVLSILEHFKCDHIGHSENTKVKLIPALINNRLLNDTEIKDIAKKDNTISFLDYRYKNIPESFVNILYPNTDKHITLFSKHFLHPQNLGETTEIEKFELLKNNKYYLDIDNTYLYEAVLSGAKILKIINDNVSSVDISVPGDIKTYDEFLGEYL